MRARPYCSERMTKVTHPIEQAIARMGACASEKLRQRCLADELGLSRSYFARRFRVETGMSPHQYLSQLRIHRAQYLLGKTHKRLVDIALELGFCSQSHFTQSFRSHVGVTPKRFRTLVAETESRSVKRTG